MFCKKCGEDIPDDSQFCPFCAEEIGRPAAPEPPPPPVATAPLQQPEPVYQQPAAPPSQQPGDQQPISAPQYPAVQAAPQSSGSGAIVGVIVALVFVVMLVGGVGAYMVIKKLGLKPPVGTVADAGGSSATETPVDASDGSATQATGETATECVSNLKQLALGALMYSQDHNDKLPPAAWVTAISQYTNNSSILRCPSRPDLQVAYAMNQELLGVALSDIASPAETVLFFETTMAASSPVGGWDLVAEGGIHDGGIAVAFADGHAKWLPVNQVTRAMFGSASVGDSSVTAGAVTSGGGGSPSTWPGLDDLAGVWRVDLAQLDGPPPTTLTMVRQGDTVMGTLNGRTNTRLELRASGGDMHYEGTWTDPQVGTVAAEALIMPEGTLEVFSLDGAGGAELLISVRARRSLD